VAQNFSPKDFKDQLFRVKKFQYNTYVVDHAQVKGILRLANVVTNILEIPEEQVPPDARNPDTPSFMLGYQAIVSFSNNGEKKRTFH